MRAFFHRLFTLLANKTAPALAETPTTAAVRRAFLRCGLPADQFGPDFNLLRAGKLEQVYHLAARDLGVDAEFDTVGDVIKWLDE